MLTHGTTAARTFTRRDAVRLVAAAAALIVALSAILALRLLVNPFRLPDGQPAVVEGARVLLGELDVEHVELGLHVVAELHALRVVLLIPHPGELRILLFDHGRHRLNALGNTVRVRGEADRGSLGHEDAPSERDVPHKGFHKVVV